VQPHVTAARMHLGSLLRSAFSSRMLFGVEAMRKAFNVLFALALILGVASTVAANAQLGTALQVQSASNLR
jgi:hypothetical protein